MITITPNFVDETFEQEVLKLVPYVPQRGEHRNQVLRYGEHNEAYHKMVSDKIPDVFLPLKDKLSFDIILIFDFSGITISFGRDPLSSRRTETNGEGLCKGIKSQLKLSLSFISQTKKPFSRSSPNDC